MAPQPKQAPEGLKERVARHFDCRAELVGPEIVESQIWNGTTYLFDLTKPNHPKYVWNFKVYLFALNQVVGDPDWRVCFQGPAAPSGKAAVLGALREAKFVEKLKP